MGKYKKSYIISSFQVDIQQKLRIRSLFNLFQDLADEHAEKIGVGYTYCSQNNIGWVGGAYHLKINRLPTWGEEISIDTWPSGTTAACGIRDFLMKDKSGHILVNATSQWVLIDTKRFRPIPVAKHLPHYELTDDHALVSAFDKICLPDGDVSKTLSFPVHADDIDLNHHVNNALYPTWVLDSFDDEFRSTHYPTELQITFKRSAKFGDTILLNAYHKKDQTIATLTDTDGNTEFARVLMIWAKE